MKRFWLVLISLLVVGCTAAGQNPKTGGRPILRENPTVVVLDPTPATTDPDAVPFTAQSIRIAWREGAFDPQVGVYRNKKELNAALVSERSEDGGPIDSALSEYDDPFFLVQELIVVRMESGSGSNRFAADDVQRTDGGITVTVNAFVPEVGTSDMAGWLLLIAVPAGTCETIPLVELQSVSV